VETPGRRGEGAGPGGGAPPPAPAPVDDRRLARLAAGALVVLGRGDRHTPLERQWAQQVLDLAAALAEARGLGRLPGA